MITTKIRAIVVAVQVAVATTAVSFAAPILTPDQMSSDERIEMSNAWVEIDEGAYLRNIAKVRTTLNPDTELCVIIKADAYGAGIDLLMPALQKADVSCLGFASNDEARIARAHDFKGDLLRVRTGTIGETKHSLQYDIVEIVGSLEHAQKISELGVSSDVKIPVHLAINAGGLSRNGIELATENGKQDALDIVQLPGIEVTGLMTHYPVEDVEDIKKDLALFNEQVDWLLETAKLNREDLLIHSSNSFATLNLPEAQFDAVRVGGGVFGDIKSDLNFENIMSLKTKVASINEYPKGNTVGYDRTITLDRDSRLANLPMGYSDGYRRAFSNKAYVLINGHKVPVVGKVSMNTTMVDITDYPDIKDGDEVVIFGKQGDAEITQAEIEESIDALMADVYTMWGNSNPRILIKAEEK